MPNLHTPQRLVDLNESFEQYKQRRIASKLVADRMINPHKYINEVKIKDNPSKRYMIQHMSLLIANGIKAFKKVTNKPHKARNKRAKDKDYSNYLVNISHE